MIESDEEFEDTKNLCPECKSKIDTSKLRPGLFKCKCGKKLVLERQIEKWKGGGYISSDKPIEDKGETIDDGLFANKTTTMFDDKIPTTKEAEIKFKKKWGF